jgi:hypothetical protein
LDRFDGGQATSALQKSRMILAAPARTAHHDHLMRGEIAETQPPIALLPADQKRNVITVPLAL